MTNEERDALVFGVEIRDTDEDGEEVTTLFVDGECVWSDTHFEPEDILLGRDLRAFVKVIRKLAKERHDARAQLAALCARTQTLTNHLVASDGLMEPPPQTAVRANSWAFVSAVEDTRRLLADLATAAAAHDARVRAPVEAERDQLAAALAEVRDAASESIRESFWVGNDAPARAARERVIAVLASLPADLAAQREARVRADERAKAIEACRLTAGKMAEAMSNRNHAASHGMHLVAVRLCEMADEAERGGA